MSTKNTSAEMKNFFRKNEKEELELTAKVGQSLFNTVRFIIFRIYKTST